MKTYGVKIESSLVKFSQKLFFKKVSSVATSSNVLTLSESNELTRVASSNLSFDGLINTNVDTNKFVVLGSDGYLAYRTGTEIQDDLDVTPGTDVVNLVTMISDSGHGARSAQTGQPSFTFLGGEGIDLTNSSGTFTVSGEDASTSNKGIVELATTAETTTGTDDTRAVTPDGLKDGYQGSTNVTTLGSITTGVWRGDVIDQAYLGGVSGTNTGDEPDASESVKGIVELATTAEADAGTDTSRAVTPAGLKSHVDARSTYQYISFVGNITANTSGNGYWEYPSPNGISNHTWTQIVQTKVDGTDNRDTTTVGDEVGIDRLNQGSAGIRIPYAGTIVGFTGSGRNASGDRTFYGGLFVGTPDWGTINKIDAELIAVAQADNTPGGTYTSRASKVEDLSRSYSISAGDVIYPAIKGSGTNADIIQISFTIVIKTLII